MGLTICDQHGEAFIAFVTPRMERDAQAIHDHRPICYQVRVDWGVGHSISYHVDDVFYASTPWFRSVIPERTFERESKVFDQFQPMWEKCLDEKFRIIKG